MPKRPPTLAQRLRSAWSTASEPTRILGRSAASSGRHLKGADFADRLRAAVSARH